MGVWRFDEKTDLEPAAYLGQVGSVFATFDARTQDSGNVSFGVEAGERRWFVKTAGDPADSKPFLAHEARVDLLINAQRLAQTVSHPALRAQHGITQSAWGPMLIYEWVEGELLNVPAARREDPESALQRFRSLPTDERRLSHLRLCGSSNLAD